MCLRDLARVIGLTFDSDPLPDDPIQLTEDNFQDALEHLATAGWPMERDAASVVDPLPRLARELRVAGIPHSPTQSTLRPRSGPVRVATSRRDCNRRSGRRIASRRSSSQRIRKLTAKRRSTRDAAA